MILFSAPPFLALIKAIVTGAVKAFLNNFQIFIPNDAYGIFQINIREVRKNWDLAQF